MDGRASLGLAWELGERKVEMDYVIAGIAAVLLFLYLIYALLKPERF
ncbi:MAG: K(+)-transporting ATPase subunit F [Paludibaculum sp.]